MCWNEPVSYVTFALGTLFNIGSYIYLRKTGSIVAPLAFYWQFALLMQLPEGAAWTILDRGDGNIAAASNTAMVLNVLQPVALLATVWIGYRRLPVPAAVATLMYVILILADISTIWSESDSIAPDPGCSHLDLRWWNGSRTALYVFASLFGFCAIPSLVRAAVNILIYLITLLIAGVAYPCGGGSMWCWMIFLAGIILAAVESATQLALGRKRARRVLRATRVTWRRK